MKSWFESWLSRQDIELQIRTDPEMRAAMAPAPTDWITRPDEREDVELVLDEEWSEKPQCRRGDGPAVVRLVSKCCKWQTLECAEHWAYEKTYFEARVEGQQCACSRCKKAFPPGTLWEDFIEEFPL
jgi:hypothetical protein